MREAQAYESFVKDKQDTLKKIEEAARQGNTGIIYVYSHLMMDLERKYEREERYRLPKDSDYVAVEFKI